MAKGDKAINSNVQADTRQQGPRAYGGGGGTANQQQLINGIKSQITEHLNKLSDNLSTIYAQEAKKALESLDGVVTPLRAEISELRVQVGTLDRELRDLTAILTDAATGWSGTASQTTQAGGAGQAQQTQQIPKAPEQKVDTSQANAATNAAQTTTGKVDAAQQQTGGGNGAKQVGTSAASAQSGQVSGVVQPAAQAPLVFVLSPASVAPAIGAMSVMPWGRTTAMTGGTGPSPQQTALDQELANYFGIGTRPTLPPGNVPGSNTVPIPPYTVPGGPYAPGEPKPSYST